MSNAMNDNELDKVGKYTAYLLPVLIPGGLYLYYRNNTAQVDQYIDEYLPLIQSILYGILIGGIILIATIILRFYIIRKREKNEYQYFRIVPHIDMKNNPKNIHEMVQRFSGYRRPKSVRSYKGREWFQWLVHCNNDGEIAFYIGFPSDRATGMIQTIKNCYPKAELRQVRDIEFPKGMSYAGKMGMTYKGLDAALPLAEFNGSDGIAGMLSYMRPNTWVDLTFSPQSMWTLRKKLRKSEKKMRKAHRNTSDMDSFEKERYQAIGGRLTGRDNVFSVSFSITSQSERNSAVVNNIANQSAGMMGEDNGILFQRGTNQIKFCPYPTKTMTWTNKEIANLLHLPNINQSEIGDIPHLKRGQRELLPNELNKGVTVGHMQHPVEKGREVKISHSQLSEHFFLSGATGSGKSSIIIMMIDSMIQDWLKNPKKSPGFTFADPARTTVQTIMNRLLLAETKGADIPWEKIHYFRFKDTDYPIGLNLLHKNKGEDSDTVVNNIMALIKTVYPGDTPRLDKYMRNTFQALIEDKEQHTVLGVYKMITDSNFRGKIIAKIEDPVLKDFWLSQSEKDLKAVEDPIYSRVSSFQTSVFMRRMFGQTKWSLPIKKYMDEGHIVLLDVKGLGELNVPLTIGHIITQYHQIAQTRSAYPKTHPFIVDESHLIQIPVMDKIIAEDRKFGFFLGLATQFPSQYRKWLIKAIDGNVQNIISGAQGGGESEIMAGLMKNTFTPETLQSLPNRHAALITKYDTGKGKDLTSCLIESEPPYMYLPDGSTAEYQNDKEQYDATSWANEKASELQKRDAIHYKSIDEAVAQYLGVSGDKNETEQNLFLGGDSGKEELENNDTPLVNHGKSDIMDTENKKTDKEKDVAKDAENEQALFLD